LSSAIRRRSSPSQTICRTPTLLSEKIGVV
jgi:hypothetical protein